MGVSFMRYVYLILLTAFIISFMVCDSVPFTAPSGSSIVLIANPEHIDVDTGQSTITAIVTEEDGKPVSDGTSIYFSSNIGKLEHQKLETKNGICTNVFYADSIAGEAHIRAHSGAATSSDVIVKIGAGHAVRMTLSVQPSTITQGGTSQIICTLWGENNQPVANQAVIFSAYNGSIQSGGAVLYTNPNGQVVDYVIADSIIEPPYDILIMASSGSMDEMEIIQVIQ